MIRKLSPTGIALAREIAGALDADQRVKFQRLLDEIALPVDGVYEPKAAVMHRAAEVLKIVEAFDLDNDNEGGMTP